MNGSLRVGNLFGIPFYVNPSWFLVLALITWSNGGWYMAQFPWLGSAAWVLGLATSLLFFTSVLLHELGHSVVAMRQGIEVKSITLFIFGGLASLGDEPKTPWNMFTVAIAGPLVSFALAAVLTGIGLLSSVSGPWAALVGLLAYINMALGLFNLIPGLPLDGGNVLKALVWKITGKSYKGVAFASRVGQLFGWLGIILGISPFLDIAIPIPILRGFATPWTFLVGLFLLQNAGFSAQTAAIQEKLSGLTAADAVIPNSPIIAGSKSLRELANDYIIGNEIKWRKFLVTDDSGQLVGEILVDDLKNVPTNDWWNVPVQTLTKPLSEVDTVPCTRPLLEVVTLLEEKKLSSLAVVREDGVVMGLLEKNSIAGLLQAKANAEAT
ncbi:MAG TPA: site-2 protease family protein [Chroococcidiopsis sp.]